MSKFLITKTRQPWLPLLDLSPVLQEGEEGVMDCPLEEEVDLSQGGMIDTVVSVRNQGHLKETRQTWLGH